MAGRYGPDHLNGALVIIALVISVVSSITAFPVLMYLSYLLLLVAAFRMLSRNIRKRRAENDRFLRYWWPIRQKIKAFFSNLKNRKTHMLYKCPSCSNLLRVPRGRGKIQITCPKCGERFIRKT
jgi:DNA-directed RNA polymerase subunit RPC12/RpoP